MSVFNGLWSFGRASIARVRPGIVVQGLVLLVCLAALEACGTPSGPNPTRVEPLTPAQITQTQVLVSDTQIRLLGGISSAKIRDQVGTDLRSLAARITDGNSAEVQLLARRAATTLLLYYQTSDHTDGPDISAMLLSLNSVARTAGNTDADISL
jgi:hypothetical protein